jgi:hypothetical protein
MKIHCRSNIDLRQEQWPEMVEARPQVGDIIESKTAWGPNKIHLELAVVGVKYRWFPYSGGPLGEWGLIVELHLPPHTFEHFTAFQQWYKDILR